MRFSKSNQTFYPEGLDYPSLPSDLVIVSEEDHARAVTRAHGETLDFVGGKLVIIAAPKPALELLQASKIAAIKSECVDYIRKGFECSALGAVYTYPTKDLDQQNLNSAVLASYAAPNGWTTSFWCEDSKGTWALLEHTADQIQKVGLASRNFIAGALKKCADLAETVQAAQEADLDSIKW